MGFFNWVVVYFVLTQTITSRKQFITILIIFLLASLKLSQYGARTLALRGFAFADWGLAGPQGFFQNPGELAIQMLVFAPMALFFTIGIKTYLKRWQVWLLHSMPITAILTVLGTNTRGGQLALAVQVLALIAMTKHRIRTFILIGLIGVIGFALLPDQQKARFEDIGSDDTSIQRLLYWKHGWQMIKDHPWLGVGYNNFRPYYSSYCLDDIVLNKLGDHSELPHNIFIQVGTDAGFSGLSVFVFLIAASFFMMHHIGKEARKADDDFLMYMTKGMNLALIGFVVAGQFVTVTYYPFFWIHLSLVTSIMTFNQNETTAPMVRGVPLSTPSDSFGHSPEKRYVRS